MKVLKAFFIIALLSANLQSNSHGLKMSRFLLGKTSDHFELTAQFDLADLLQTVSRECPEFNNAEKASWEKYLTTYLYDHITIASGDESIHYKIELSSMDHHSIFFSGTTNPVTSSLSEISISNDCMVAQIEDYSNVISIRTGEDIRSFRLSKTRTSTQIKF